MDDDKLAARLAGNRRGGMARTAVKSQASRINGKLGGRPKAKPPLKTMAETIAEAVRSAADEFYAAHPEYRR